MATNAQLKGAAESLLLTGRTEVSVSLEELIEYCRIFQDILRVNEYGRIAPNDNPFWEYDNRVWRVWLAQHLEDYRTLRDCYDFSNAKLKRGNFFMASKRNGRYVI